MSEMNEINRRQLDDTGKKLRYSFKCWYNKAKRVNSIIIFFSFVISILSVFNILYNLKLNKFIALIGSIWIFISILLKKKANNYRKIGADVQEEFDTYVFGIKKNNVISIPKIEREDIYIYINKKGQESLEPYYEGLDSSDKMRNILIAQRGNIVYDKKMRTNYCYGNEYAMAIYLIVFIALGITHELKVEEFIGLIIIPAINILVYFIDNILMIKSELDVLQEGELSIERFFENSHDNRAKEISELNCREYQDFIYLKRRNWVMIPNYIYRLYNKNNEEARKIVNKQLSSN